MKTFKTISVGVTRLAAGFALSLSTAVPVSAADWSYKYPEMPATFTSEVGGRIWYGFGRTGKNLFGTTGTALVSRLSYNDFAIAGGEAFGRFDYNSGWFIKSYIGGAALWDGKLTDEDFGLEPPLQPYSATISPNKNSSVVYGSIDAGFKVLRGQDFHVGLFAGYHFMRQTISAYGCVQVAVNPLLCGDNPVPETFKVITQVNNWNSLRLGVDAAVEFDRRWKLSVDAAWAPYVHLSGADAHLLRIGTDVGDFIGPVPEDGNGWGYQLDAFLSYRINDSVSVGVGGRYWHMEAKGYTHFENHVVGVDALPQHVNWKTDNVGVFLQTTFKLGPYPVFGM